MLPHFSSCLHDPSIGIMVNSVEKMYPTDFLRKWYLIQHASCGNRNQVWNSVRKFFVSRNFWNAQDAKSAMPFFMPTMCKVVSGDAWHVLILTANILNSCAALTAFVDSNLEAHATIGVLSHQHATCVWAKLAKFSNTSQCKIKPSIWRSKFEMVPLELSYDTICAWISFGSLTHQTIGGKWHSKPNQTPPAPFLDVFLIASVVGQCLDKVSTWCWMLICYL